MVKKKSDKKHRKKHEKKLKTNSKIKKSNVKKKKLSMHHLIKSAPHPPKNVKIKKHELIKHIKIIKVKKPKKIKVKKVRHYFKHKRIHKIIPHKPHAIHVSATETDFDRLVNLVNEKEVVKLSAVAKKFNTTVKQAEEWGKILDTHNLIHLHYPGFGEPELRKWKKQ